MQKARTFGEVTLSLISTIYNSIVAYFMVRDDERGQTLVEYALIIALVSVMLVAALVALQGGIQGAFEAINTALGGATGGGGGS